MAEDKEPGLRTAMTERRCLPCLHWRFDDESPEAAEREIQARFGPQVAVVGDCRHPESRKATTNSLWVCELWEPKLREG
jgi:hypothetical protein